MQHYFSFPIDLDSDAGRYFTSCARIRNICMRSLMKRVIDVIAHDQLMTAILDDDGRTMVLHKGEHRFREAVVQSTGAGGTK